MSYLIEKVAVYRTPKMVQARREPFGGLVCAGRGPIVKLDKVHYSLWVACKDKVISKSVLAGINRSDLHSAIERLEKAGLLQMDYSGADEIWAAEELLFFLTSEQKQTTWPTISPPLWAHIQPFTICNQNCIHCYCSGGPRASRPLIDSCGWITIVDKLIATGVFEIYLTGGEVFASDLTMEVTDHILSKGLCTGLSTNATIIEQRHLEWLAAREFSTIQVSLDGATPEVHDEIRAHKGAFYKTIEGVHKLRGVVDVIINSVINKRNLYQVAELAKLAESIGAVSIKFFPQKLCGRAQETDCLNEKEWAAIPFGEIKSNCSIPIEAPTPAVRCSSGHSGLAIDQHGDIYPCIFAVENTKLRCGNILTDEILEIWSGSVKLLNFRHEPRDYLCKRCEKNPTPSCY
jgi:radical SAM protein with 4Fe4S-binding SPASM domain